MWCHLPSAWRIPINISQRACRWWRILFLSYHCYSLAFFIFAGYRILSCHIFFCSFRTLKYVFCYLVHLYTMYCFLWMLSRFSLYIQFSVILLWWTEVSFCFCFSHMAFPYFSKDCDLTEDYKDFLTDFSLMFYSVQFYI